MTNAIAVYLKLTDHVVAMCTVQSPRTRVPTVAETVGTGDQLATRMRVILNPVQVGNVRALDIDTSLLDVAMVTMPGRAFPSVAEWQVSHPPGGDPVLAPLRTPTDPATMLFDPTNEVTFVYGRYASQTWTWDVAAVQPVSGVAALPPPIQQGDVLFARGYPAIRVP
jgi:hypothetical protein